MALSFIVLLNSVSALPLVWISEVDSNQAGSDSAEFVELYDGGFGSTPLDGLALVLFNGTTDVAYAVYPLDGYATSEDGYFLVGSAGITPSPDLEFESGFLQNGADAVALYDVSEIALSVGQGVSTFNLLDAIVYDNGQADDVGLVPLLVHGRLQVNENSGGLGETVSIQVCLMQTPPELANIVLAAPTPGAANACISTPPSVVINEVDVDQEGSDTGEFVELYDGGLGLTPLDGLTVVFFNGSTDAAYAVFPLAGYATDGNGYFLLGNAAQDPDLQFANGLLQNGPDAVALYAESVSVGALATSVGLRDALVYVTDDADDVELLEILTPGESSVDEGSSVTAPVHSMQRCPNGEGVPFTLTPYRMAAPTPRAPNTCPANLPIAAFSPNPSVVFVGDEVSFQDASIGSLLAYQWDFADASPATSNEANPAGVAFISPGLKRVTLVVSNGSGADLAEFMLEVLDPTPQFEGIAVTGSPAACGALTLEVTDLSGRPPVSVAWEVKSPEQQTVFMATGTPVVWQLDEDVLPGSYEVSAVATNASGSTDLAALPISVGDTRPDVEVSTTVEMPTNQPEVRVDIAIDSEDIATGLGPEDLILDNLALLDFDVADNLYSATLAFLDEGPATISVTAHAAEILCGVPTRASNILQLQLDSTPPVLTLASSAPRVAPNPLLRIDVGASEAIIGLLENDFLLENATLTDLYVDGAGYTAFAFALAPGAYTIQIRGGAVRDAAGNLNAPSAILEYAYIPLPEGEQPYSHSADINSDGHLQLAELLRVVQLYNASSLHCDEESEDGFAPGEGNLLCYAHSADYSPEDWTLSLSELLRVIQIFSLGAYQSCPLTIDSQDGYCTGELTP